MSTTIDPKELGCDSLVSRLRAERDDLMRRYNRLPRRDSFSGWELADKIEAVDRRLETAEIEAANAKLSHEEGGKDL